MDDVSRRELIRRAGIGVGGALAISGLSGLLVACGDDEDEDGAATSSTTVKPKIGLSAPPQASWITAMSGPVLVGAKFGLPAITRDDFNIFDSSTTVSQSALSGQVNLVGQSMLAQLLIADKQLPFKIFTPFSLSDDFVIAARTEVKTLEQLKDPKTVFAADSPGGAGQTVANAMLKARSAGFLVADIPKVVTIESSGERTSALANGDCDATVIHLVQSNAIEEQVGGVNILARLYGEVPNFMTYAYAAPQEWLEENMETAAAVTASVIQSSRDLKADYSAFESAVNQLIEEPPEASELKVLYELVQQYEIFPVDAELSDERTQFMIDLGKEQGLIKSDLTPDKVLDRRPMERAQELLKS